MPKITVDEGLCQAHGRCSQVAPAFFRHDADFDVVDQAVFSCPVYALEIDDQ